VDEAMAELIRGGPGAWLIRKQRADPTKLVLEVNGDKNIKLEDQRVKSMTPEEDLIVKSMTPEEEAKIAAAKKAALHPNFNEGAHLKNVGEWSISPNMQMQQMVAPYLPATLIVEIEGVGKTHVSPEDWSVKDLKEKADELAGHHVEVGQLILPRTRRAQRVQ